MWSYRTCRLSRCTRGLLITVATLTILAGVAYIHHFEPTAKLILSGHSRVLQQLTCKNCSETAVIATPTAIEIVSAALEEAIGANKRLPEEPALSQNEEVPPDEALPEEMVPDQEPPAVQPAKPEPVEQQSASQTEAQKEEKPAAKVSLPDIEAVKKPKAAVNQKADTSKAMPVPPPPPPAAYENPTVLTKTLYSKGHVLPARDVCPNKGEGLKLMVLVTTAPSHSAQREAVRSTWGHYAFRRDVGMAFFVGTSLNQQDNQIIERENLVYGDIIQGRFVDTYNNLTLKTISMLEWSAVYCNRARFLLKTDDDMYINFPVLLPILDNPKHQKKAIIGKVAKKWKPIRNMTSKYYISPAQFKPVLYPDFNTGPAYVLTNDVIQPLYKESLEGMFFKLEDVYVTGMMASKLKIGHFDYPQFYNRPMKQETCAVKKLASVHMVKPHEMFSLWTRLSDGQTKCPPK